MRASRSFYLISRSADGKSRASIAADLDDHKTPTRVFTFRDKGRGRENEYPDGTLQNIFGPGSGGYRVKFCIHAVLSVAISFVSSFDDLFAVSC